MNIVERVKNAEASWSWASITLTSPELPDYVLIINTMCDAMKIKIDDKLVRFMVTAAEQQQIADLIYGIFHTSKTADARHVQSATKIPAVVQVPPRSGKITALSNEVEYSHCVDVALEKCGKNQSDFGIISTVGKPWVVTPNMSKQQKWGQKTAYNYGWHDDAAIYKSPNGLKIWQPIVNGMAPLVHNDCHKDPSQVCEMLHRRAELQHPNGEITIVDLRDIYSSSELWKLVSYDGPIENPRQRSVQETIPTSYITPHIYV